MTKEFRLKRTRISLQMPVIVVLLLGTISMAGDRQANSVSLDSPEAAVEAALRIVPPSSDGDSRGTQGVYPRAILVDSDYSQQAFIADEINMRRSWRIEANVDLGAVLLDTEDLSSPYPKKMSMFLDSTTGILLEARFGSEDDRGTTYRMPTAAEAEFQLSDFGERYLGLPKEAPKVSLIDALKACDGRPLVAEETIVSYVVYAIEISQGDTRRTYGPCPAWVIYTRGLQPISAQAPASMTTNLRTVVDATTGDKIITNNLPYPIIDE